jgi:hypothetical protein
VPLKFEGTKEHKGFKLQGFVILDENIIVLTGRNGSGKTRISIYYWVASFSEEPTLFAALNKLTLLFHALYLILMIKY